MFFLFLEKHFKITYLGIFPVFQGCFSEISFLFIDDFSNLWQFLDTYFSFLQNGKNSEKITLKGNHLPKSNLSHCCNLTKGYWMRNNQNRGWKWNGNLYNINKIQYLQEVGKRNHCLRWLLCISTLFILYPTNGQVLHKAFFKVGPDAGLQPTCIRQNPKMLSALLAPPKGGSSDARKQTTNNW